jgi:hypothetical protein
VEEVLNNNVIVFDKNIMFSKGVTLNLQVYYIVTAYMNKRQEIFLNATATNSIEINAATNRILTIKSPYTPESIGEQIENSFGICLSEPVWDEKMQGKVQDYLGFNSKVLFQKEHIHVIIEFNKDNSLMKLIKAFQLCQ